MDRDPLVARYAWYVALATLVSGPLGFGLTLLYPHGHFVQAFPYWAGFALIAANVLWLARLVALSFDAQRTRGLATLVATGMYAALVGLNYALQVAYVPYASRHADPALGYVTMTNPNAVTWVLEMFGYGFLGVATATIAPAITGVTASRRWIRALLRANGAISVAGAVATAANLAWVQTPAGITAFLAWNVLVIALAVLVAVDFAPASSTIRR